ncbi:hypothetical protein ACUNWD_05250 [Sunxiuqinia sp. A32]|uniref:hypothetical protein n=1 Tax=Sunxiuqinia sp. A32 TaxID=3461496 RepID=UPI0040468634
MFYRLSIFVILIGLSKFSVSQAPQKDALLFNVPPYFIANAECYINGPFDADMSNTIICFQNIETGSFSPAPILEGEDKILFKVPDTFGEYKLIIVDEGNNHKLFVPVNVIKLEMDWEETNSNKKKPVPFHINFMGAEKTNQEFSFSIKNMSPHIISIIGGNNQEHKILSTRNTDKVSWEGKFVVIEEDEFSILGTVDQPTPSVKAPLFSY